MEHRPPLWLIFTITAMGISTVSLIVPILADVTAGLGVDPSSAGLIMAAVSLPGIVTAPILGAVADLLGRRTAITLSLLLTAVGGLLAGTSTSLGVMLTYRMVQGIGSAGLIYLAIVVIGDHWDGAERARYIGWNVGVLTATLAVTPYLSGLIAERWGWRAPFMLFGGGLLLAIAVFRNIQDRRRQAVSLGQQWRAALPVLRSPVMATSQALGVVLFMIVFGLKYVVLPVSLATNYGLSPSAIGLVVSTPAITSTLGAFVLSHIHARIGRAVTLLAGVASYGIAALLFAAIPSLWVVIAAALIFGVGDGTALPTIDVYVTGAGGASTRGTVVSFYGGSTRVGQTLGSVAAVGTLGSVGVVATFLFGGALATVTFIGVLFARSRAWISR